MASEHKQHGTSDWRAEDDAASETQLARGQFGQAATGAAAPVHAATKDSSSDTLVVGVPEAAWGGDAPNQAAVNGSLSTDGLNTISHSSEQ